jgi:hypothetical protein
MEVASPLAENDFSLTERKTVPSVKLPLFTAILTQ